ncbi:phospholipid carrier-dependent glycosyltransferase [candidate division WWE3 bacterium]|jgi:4-amino-4-deoxy-L-arabinose transferase-like glycosyltransferase|nr:phospholipid carrier-dependent glycosyltransferase [candidate division WWE3 bacterium]
MLRTKPTRIYLYILLLVTVTLRLINLSYSDYIQDEVTTFFYWGGMKNVTMTPYNFLLNEQKGPLQVLVGYIPRAIVGNYDNALAQRLPFALFGIASVLMFYYMVEKLTKNSLVAFLAAFLFSTNGLILGYSRIAQYQNLLFFFSFSSLYYFADLINAKLKGANLMRSTIIGSVLFSIGFYAHWYAVFILIPIGYLIAVFLLNKKRPIKIKITVILANLLIVLALILPYYVPYIKNLLGSERNTDYAERLLGKGKPFSERRDLKQFFLYNPFLTYYLYLALGFIGIVVSRKKVIFTVWFLVVLAFFRYFVLYTGLHFYNIFIPLIILVAYGMSFFLKSKLRLVRYASTVLVALVLAFLYVQSYLVFVDHRTEYPMQQEQILYWKTRSYSHEDRMRHKTGFPHKRYWEEINAWVNEQNLTHEVPYDYHTNEDKGIARIYMDSSQSREDHLYIIGIKNPYSMAYDFKFSQFKPKSTVHTIENEYGVNVVRIYRLDERNEK